jgi:hypothetical protein
MTQKMRLINLVLGTALAIAGAAGCSSTAKVDDKNQPPTTVSNEAKSAAAQRNATFVTEVAFPKGSDGLSEQSRESLNDLIARAKSTGQIDEVKVVSWADREYPSESTKKLSKEERELADHRSERIKDYLKVVDKSLDVDSFNMAERPGALATLFKTENAKVKKSLEVAGISHTDSKISAPEKAGKSMVMVILKD